MPHKQVSRTKPASKRKLTRPLLIALGTVVAIAAVGILVILVASGHRPLTVARDWDQIVGAQKPVLTGFVQQYYNLSTFTLTDTIHHDDGTGTATVTVTTPEMRSILKAVLTELDTTAQGLSDKERETLAQGRLAALLVPDCAKTTTTFEVPLQRIGRKWKIVPTKEWSDAVTAGMAEILREYYGQILKGDAS